LSSRKGIWPVKMGDGGGGHWLVRMEWRPARWSVCLPLLIFLCTIKSRSYLLAPAHQGGPGKKGRKMVVVVDISLNCCSNTAVIHTSCIWHIVSSIILSLRPYWFFICLKASTLLENASMTCAKSEVLLLNHKTSCVFTPHLPKYQCYVNVSSAAVAMDDHSVARVRNK